MQLCVLADLYSILNGQRYMSPIVFEEFQPIFRTAARTSLNIRKKGGGRYQIAKRCGVSSILLFTPLCRHHTIGMVCYKISHMPSTIYRLLNICSYIYEAWPHLMWPCMSSPWNELPLRHSLHHMSRYIYETSYCTSSSVIPNTPP